ncbi:hypothetical protein HBI56_221610 [Parastagonospora nodorum]|nr:hypothetical protein HBI09_215390 [Parastagonospora nodorum]KAH4216916.1 hypothetical protein HBI06_222610 [Parastagonospora nodorum]KAH4226173.1 hypothetical protein HBI05_224280 [Parastagonospora nodorum]KAH4335501.1 hypothetical protein HBH98_234560 [Parastagonospora nodorum]KAH4358212.1 hypothetical protein HBH97_219240 [Parastagonospora nodorum]
MPPHEPGPSPSEAAHPDESIADNFTHHIEAFAQVARNGQSNQVKAAFQTAHERLWTTASIKANRTYRRDNPHVATDLVFIGWQMLVDHGEEPLCSQFWQAVALWGTHQHFLQTWETFTAERCAPTAAQDVSSIKVRDVPAAFRSLRAILCIQHAWGPDCYCRLLRVAPFPVSPKQSFLEKVAKLARIKMNLADVERDFPKFLKHRIANHQNNISLEKSLQAGTYTVSLGDLEEYIAETTSKTKLLEHPYREPSRRDRTRKGPRTRQPSSARTSIASPELPRHGPLPSLSELDASDAGESEGEDFPPSPCSETSKRASPDLDIPTDECLMEESSAADDNILLSAEAAELPHPSKIEPQQVSVAGLDSVVSPSRASGAQTAVMNPAHVPSGKPPQVPVSTATETEINRPPPLSETKSLPSPPLSEISPSVGGPGVDTNKRDNKATETSDTDGNAQRKRPRIHGAISRGSSDLEPKAQLTSRTLDLLLTQLTSGLHPDDYAFYDPGDLEVSELPAKVSPGKFSKTRNVLVPLCLCRHWILLQFNMQYMKVYKYDSLPGHIAPFVVGEKVALIRTAIWGAAGRADEDLPHWTPIVHVAVPEQGNDFDCGISVLITTLRITNGYDGNPTGNMALWRMLLQALESNGGRVQALIHFAKFLSESQSIVPLRREFHTIRDLTQSAYAAAETRQQEQSDCALRLARVIEAEQSSRRRQSNYLRKHIKNVQALEEEDAALETYWRQQLKPVQQRLATLKDNVTNLQRLQGLVAEFAEMVDEKQRKRVKELESDLVARRAKMSQEQDVCRGMEAELAGLKGDGGSFEGASPSLVPS